MANSPIFYPDPVTAGTGRPPGPTVVEDNEKQKRVNGPILLDGTETADGAWFGESLSEVPHPLARAKSPLATSHFFGGAWIQATYVVLDMSFVLLNFVLAAKLRALSPYGGGAESYLPPHPFGFLLLYVPLVALFAHTQGLYRTARDRSRFDEGLAVAKAVCLATVLVTASIYTSGVHYIPRLVVWGGALLNIIALSGWRFWKRGIVERRVAAGVGTKNVLIVGAGKVAQEVAEYLSVNKQLGLVVKGFLDQDPSRNPRVLGKIEDLSAVARAQFVDEVIITIPSMRHVVKRVIFEARRNNLDIKIVPRVYEACGRQATIDYLGEIPLMSLYREPVPVIGRVIKRALDVAGSLFGLAVLSPVLLAIAAIIKWDSPGPIFYRCGRMGKRGKSFVCYKFRSMVVNADSLKDSLRHLNEREGAIFKITDDPRVTRVGRFLRKYSLDEFPQLLNVLRGDMSLVGPRPHPIDDYRKYRLEHLRRLDITPGITGLWQVTARRHPSFEKSVALDLEYIEHWSMWMDFSILFRTVSAVVSGNGA
jgi:exopolysaccharide biosynthesis polyprenyl glycosylphosphotransferase